MGTAIRPLFALTLAIFIALSASAAEVKTYDSKYYSIKSDTDPLLVREATLRMTYMVDEYNSRFKDFTGVFNHKFNLRLCRDADSFRAAGGNEKLPECEYLVGEPNDVLILWLKYTPQSFFTALQHMGFMQFTTEAMTGDQHPVPLWLKEGMGDYFAHSIFTGDCVVTGIVVRDDFDAVQQLMREDKFLPLNDLLGMDPKQFKRIAHGREYAQMWSFVHYLVHGEDGRHRAPFEKYIHDLSRGISHDEAWHAAFGEGAGSDLEPAWKKWWLAQKPEMAQEGYARAAAATLSSYLGRATAQKKSFDTVATLLAAVRSKDLKFPEADWLPDSLLPLCEESIKLAGADTHFEITRDRLNPQIVASLSDGTRMIASYNPALKDHRTQITTQGLPADIARAGELIGQKKTREAHALLTQAIKTYPRAAQLVHARELLEEADSSADVADLTPAQGGATSPHPKITLVSARYGARDKWINVTTQCQNLIAADLLAVPRDLKTSLNLAPPVPGQINFLELTIALNGAEVTVTVPDNQRLDPLNLTTQIPTELK